MTRYDYGLQSMYEMLEKMVADYAPQTPAKTVQDFLDEEPDWFKPMVNSLPGAGDIYEDLMTRFARVVVTNSLDSFFH